MTTLISKASLVPGALPAEELLHLCQHSVAPFFDVKSVENPAVPPRAPQLHQYHLGNCMFIDTDFPAQTFTRNEVWMRRHDDADHLMLQFFTHGRNEIVNGARRCTEDGQNVYAVNLALPLEARSTDSRVVMLVLPRELVKEAVPHLAQASGAIFAPGGSGACIFSDHMLSLAAHLGNATTAEAPAIVSGTLRLLDALSLRDEAHAGPAVDAAFRVACRFIECHLEDPGLGVESICGHLRCSRASLYRMFKPLGGVREHIQRRRLVACCDALTSRAHRHRQIFDIALEFGFSSPSHFSHLFREYFGMTPRDARDAGLRVSRDSRERTEARVQPGGSGNDEAERMWQWAKTLAG